MAFAHFHSFSFLLHISKFRRGKNIFRMLTVVVFQLLHSQYTHCMHIKQQQQQSQYLFSFSDIYSFFLLQFVESFACTKHTANKSIEL